ncbi:response regulator [Oceanobacillus sojae]|uniref:response regulator n=1 Tax=Oceanobacillus sojae TaxID=582851 RepID=UPI000988446E|nr:response regulator [Oceanobacillus sojae]MCT1905183.1 response regulator [Oceanobacillus sojae]
MLHIAIVDDEHLALQYLDLLLNKIEGVRVTGKYIHAGDLIQHVQVTDVDAVFIDIHMPVIKGTDLAEQLLDIKPFLHIVFVTAYDKYAVKAFELNAVDYILKPVKQERLALTIQRIMERKTAEQEFESFKSTFVIKDLGMLQIYQGDKWMEVKWRTSKAKELFAYFIHNHQNTIRKSELIDLLWNSLPWEKANAQLYTAVYQIRKVMRQINAPIKIVSQKEFYQIDMGGDIQIQSHEFKLDAQYLLQENKVDVEQYFAVLEAYGGEYLAELNYPWAVAKRKMLKELWLKLINELSEHLYLHEEPTSYNISKIKDVTGFDIKAADIIKERSRV